MKNILIILFWLLSLIIASVYTYENPERAEIVKNYFKKQKKPKAKIEQGKVQKILANSFAVEFSKKISFLDRTAFIIHESDSPIFKVDNIKIYSQNGFLTKGTKSNRLNLSNYFTTLRNGGVKAIFYHNKKEFALISSLKDDCYYASIIFLDNGKEIANTECLPGKDIDFNGLGSSHVQYNNKILLSIGAPEQRSLEIRKLAQNMKSIFGKIIEIDKNELDKIINNNAEYLNIKIYSSGHRNPQGMSKIENSIFSVEHGPRGGDELNKIIKDMNYGWPIVSYGTQYFYDNDGKSYKINHETNKFQEPIFALVPSVGISALNKCPKKLANYYKKPCLIALSLYGNSLRPGRSLIIFLLSENMNKVHSVEKIFLRDDLKLRHFVTNSFNELYEDENGSIYISADRKGIYKISFVDFR